MELDFTCGFSVCRITNLKYWGGSEQTISKSLLLLSDLSVGYTCVRKMVKLEEVIFLLSSHTVSALVCFIIGVFFFKILIILVYS